MFWRMGHVVAIFNTYWLLQQEHFNLLPLPQHSLQDPIIKFAAIDHSSPHLISNSLSDRFYTLSTWAFWLLRIEKLYECFKLWLTFLRDAIDKYGHIEASYKDIGCSDRDAPTSTFSSGAMS